MDRRELLAAIGLGALAVGLGTKRSRAAGRRLLFFTKSSGFEHSVIKVTDGHSHAERVLTQLGAEHGFEVVATKDGAIFTPESLATFDAYLFYTTGDLTQPGNDKNPPMSKEGKQALLDAIAAGKGFVGFHSATDSFHNPGGSFVNIEADQRDAYTRLIGGEFCGHGKQQQATIRVADGSFPGCGGLGAEYELLDEWYTQRNLSDDLHVILVQETEAMEGDVYRRPPFPMTWARRQGQGRSFYTGMGHREDVWTNPLFQAVILGGIGWACGDVEADVSPNVAEVCPEYQTLAPQPKPQN